MTPKIRTCFLFDGRAEEAADFYVSLFPDSRVEGAFRPSPDHPALVVDFTLAGTPYQGLNGGPPVGPSMKSSISVITADQEETDRLWEALTADGGEPNQCAWLRDRYGLFWQIVPEALPRLMTSPDRAGAQRVMEAMMTMGKIDIAAIEAAYRG